MVQLLARLVKGLAALAGLVLLAVGAPALLARVGGDPLPHRVPSLDTVVGALTARDDGSLFLRVLALVGWIAWATLMVSLVVQIPASLRGRRAIRLPGLSLQQRLAATLVGAILAVFIGGSVATAATPVRPPAVIATVPALGGPLALGAGPLSSGTLSAGPVSLGGAPVSAAPVPSLAAFQQIQRPVYVVQRGDYLGKIAVRFTGDFDRYHQIAALNPRIVRNPNLIRPGWRLTLPVDAHDRGVTRHATGRLITTGGPTAKPPTQPKPPSQPKPPTQAKPPVVVPPAAQPSAQPPQSPPAASAAASPPLLPATSGSTREPAVSAATAHAFLGIAAGLAAASVLAGHVLLFRRRAVRLHRNRLRARRVRQTRWLADAPVSPAVSIMAATEVYEPEPRPARHSTSDRLDAGLRHLGMGLRGRAEFHMPDIFAAWHYGGELGVVLAAPCADPPEPYTARSPDTWALRTSEPLPDTDGVPAPLPGLLTLGSWPEGGELYVDSERTGLLTLIGDPERCDDLLRHLAAEASGAAWADSAAVLVSGFSSADTRAIGSLNETRVRSIRDVGEALARVARRAVVNRAVLRESGTPDTLVARINNTNGSVWTTHLLFVSDPWGEHTQQLEELDAQLAAFGRVGVAVVATHPTSTRWSVSVDAEGRLDMPWLAFSDTLAEQLTGEELQALSAATGNPEYAGVPVAGARHRTRT